MFIQHLLLTFVLVASTLRDMKTETVIDLGRGYSTTVDSHTLPMLGSLRWKAQVHAKRGKIYAVAYANGTNFYMHRLLLGAQPGQKGDHRDGDGLNNRMDNLRIATISQNRANCGPRVDGGSGLKGVTWHKSSRKWLAGVTKARVKYYLGLFRDKQRAALAVDRASLALWGEFAGLNYPDRGTKPRMPAKGYVLGSRKAAA